MKYSELIDFNPIVDVIKLVDDSNARLQKNVESYVFSNKMKQDIAAQVVPNLDVTGKGFSEQKGIAVVGSYGTGKSHLMSVISAVAQDSSLIEYLQDDEVKSMFECFAGKYLVLRFEVGTDKPLRDILFTRIENFLEKNGLEYRFDAKSNLSYKELLQDMMSVFQEKFPEKHLLIVIDELLEYLKGRDPTALNVDLSVLRQIGELCDGSRFKVMYGVQELLYRDPELSHAAQAINHASDRFADLIITKEDVAYVIKMRLLRKTSVQKQAIREHLNKFSHLFTGINTQLNEYAELFPVHPSYISKFEQIKYGKSQREILKTLTKKFQELNDMDVSENEPGLITYDSYFEELKSDASMLAVPDIRKIKDNVEVINEKIESYFTGGRAGKKALAKKITNALAICALCDDLDKKSGSNAENLKENLCIVLQGIDNAELLTESIESVASNIEKATVGQYVTREEQTGDYYIRTEGGINVEQIIKDYAETVIKKSNATADKYFNQLLQYILELEQNPYRQGFPIWSQQIEWKTIKTYMEGYIFFGNPNERSTTEPIQEFYIFFCPLFGAISKNNNDNEIYFDTKGFSDEFKHAVCLYGAANAKTADATSDQKKLFDRYREDYEKKCITLFNKEYIEAIKVFYNNEEHPLKSFSMPQEGSSKLNFFKEVASKILDSHFTQKYPEHPRFTELQTAVTKSNIDIVVKDSFKVILRYQDQNRNGHAILAGLGVNGTNTVDTTKSKYAASVLKMMESKGAGKVLNRDELLRVLWQNDGLYYYIDEKVRMDYRFLFVLLAAMVYSGDIEICWDGFTLNATNINEKLLTLSTEQFFTFRTIKKPSDLPLKELKKMFSCLGLPDMTAELNNPVAFTQIQSKVKEMSETVSQTKATVSVGLFCRNISLLDENTKLDYEEKLQSLLTMLDTIGNLDTAGKLKGFKYTVQELEVAFNNLPICEKIKNIKNWSEKFENLISYLRQAQHCVSESEKPLYDDIEKTVNELGDVILSNDNKRLVQYESRLNSLKDSYADYYLKQYQIARLSYQENLKKEKLLQSEKKKICDIIKDVSILNSIDYANWLNTINSLKAADPNVTKELIKENAYQEFNPKENYGKSSYKIVDLQNELEVIFEKWEKAMLATFKDPTSKESVHLLNKKQQELAENFSTGKVQLTEQNAAILRDIINELVKGFDKIELGSQDFSEIFGQPLTVEEAKQKFNEYIESKCVGKERGKIRIILGGE